MSTLTFGGAPDNAWKGKPVSHSVVKNLNTQWTLHLNKFTINGDEFETDAKYAIPDIGSPYILLTYPDFE